MVNPPRRDSHTALRHELTTVQTQVQALRADLHTLQSHTLQSHTPLSLLHNVVNPSQVASKFIRHFPPSTLLPLARLCATGPVGVVGSRRALRAVAGYLLDHFLTVFPTHVDALCFKGELLLPYIHYGLNDPRVPRSVLQQAYACFDAAAARSPEALFLKGRWLLSMDDLHRDPAQSEKGRLCVKQAAEQGCARAHVFLAHRYENPQLDKFVSFADDVPKGKAARERFILDLYMKAAEKGDKDALNDVGTSYAQGYGGLEYDFDKAVDYYVRAINAGSVYAYDNLGTHYETGMGGRYPDRVDFRKALYYYKQGTKQHCPKCAHNLGAAYEEGMKDVLKKDVTKAEKFYLHSILLADSCNDFPTAARSGKDLAALLITRIKLLDPGDPTLEDARLKLTGLLSSQEAPDVLARVNRDIASAMKGRTGKLKEFFGEENARAIVRRAKDVEASVRGSPTVDDVMLFNHVMGVEDGVVENTKRKPKRRTRKKRRI